MSHFGGTRCVKCSISQNTTGGGCDSVGCANNTGKKKDEPPAEKPVFCKDPGCKKQEACGHHRCGYPGAGA